MRQHGLYAAFGGDDDDDDDDNNTDGTIGEMAK
jgi:hypothetical protein